jgi:hypothetical protein
MQVRRTLGMGIFNMVVVREQDASIYTCAYNDCRLRKIDFPPVPAPFPRVKTLVFLRSNSSCSCYSVRPACRV